MMLFERQGVEADMAGMTVEYRAKANIGRTLAALPDLATLPTKHQHVFDIDRRKLDKLISDAGHKALERLEAVEEDRHRFEHRHRWLS